MCTKAVKKRIQETFLCMTFDCNLSRYLCTYMVILSEYSIMVCKVYIVEERGREREGEPATRNPRNKDKTTKINTLNANGYLNRSKEKRPPDPRSKATQ